MFFVTIVAVVVLSFWCVVVVVCGCMYVVGDAFEKHAPRVVVGRSRPSSLTPSRHYVLGPQNTPLTHTHTRARARARAHTHTHTVVELLE